MGIRYKFGRPPDECAAAWLRAPILLDIGAASGFYLVPPRVTAEGMHLGLKIGDHSSGPSGDPDRDREPGAVEVELVLAQARSRLPRLDSYRIAGAKTCLYDVDPAERFRCRAASAPRNIVKEIESLEAPTTGSSC